MIYYLLYKIGHFIACAMPLRAVYFIASALADIHFLQATKEREAVKENLKIILGDIDDKELDKLARAVFRNFAKYLVDFFRFSKIDNDYIKKFVKVEGLDNVDKALALGKGAIALSAHMGNWELGALVLAMLGYPLSAVVLTHRHEKVNDFFNRQRMRANITPVEIGMSLRNCYATLKENRVLALLGDRDFTKSGMVMKLFGHDALIPKGPAAFSRRVGSALVPCFITREKDDTFRFRFEEPILPETGMDEESGMRKMTAKYLSILEEYIRKYPDQWYIFKEFWLSDEESMRPDTII